MISSIRRKPAAGNRENLPFLKTTPKLRKARGGMKIIPLVFGLAALAAISAPVAAQSTQDPATRVANVLARTPLIDGHNDLPWEIRTRFGGDLGKIDLSADTAKLPTAKGDAPLMTDIPRLR